MRLINGDALLAQLESLLKTREDDAKYSGRREAEVTWNDAIDAIKNAPIIEPEQQWIPVTKDQILQAGHEGREVRFHIGGRLFAIRELAQ